MAGPLAVVVQGVLACQTALASGGEGGTCTAHDGCFEFQIHGYYIINFVVFVALLVVFGRKKIAASLEKSYQDVAHEIEQAREAKAAAEAKLAEYQARLASLDEQNQQLLAEVRAGTQVEVEQILAEARAQVARITTEEQQRLEQESKRLRDALHDETASLALQLAEQALRERLDAAGQTRLVDGALGDLETLAAARRTTVN
jgi:F-type H+-transporting ATPase subunit b